MWPIGHVGICHNLIMVSHLANQALSPETQVSWWRALHPLAVNGYPSLKETALLPGSQWRDLHSVHWRRLHTFSVMEWYTVVPWWWVGVSCWYTGFIVFSVVILDFTEICRSSSRLNDSFGLDGNPFCYLGWVARPLVFPDDVARGPHHLSSWKLETPPAAFMEG